MLTYCLLAMAEEEIIPVEEGRVRLPEPSDPFDVPNTHAEKRAEPDNMEIDSADEDEDSATTEPPAKRARHEPATSVLEVDGPDGTPLVRTTVESRISGPRVMKNERKSEEELTRSRKVPAREGIAQWIKKKGTHFCQAKAKEYVKQYKDDALSATIDGNFYHFTFFAVLILIFKVLAGYLSCLACKEVVNHKKPSRVKQHVEGQLHVAAVAKHNKRLEEEKKSAPVQISLEGSLDKEKEKEKAKQVVLDKALNEFRIRVISECLKAGLDAEKIAKISHLLSAVDKTIPASASGVREYIPAILERQKKLAIETLGKR